MKPFLFALLLALATQAHASVVSANYGHHGATLGSSASTGEPATGMVGAPAAQSGNGGRYSLVDAYQPWPQSEMRQFAKPHFTPFDGK
jgi:hypothetical protein